jgi:hypothetical protein
MNSTETPWKPALHHHSSRPPHENTTTFSPAAVNATESVVAATTDLLNRTWELLNGSTTTVAPSGGVAEGPPQYFMSTRSGFDPQQPRWRVVVGIFVLIVGSLGAMMFVVYCLRHIRGAAGSDDPAHGEAQEKQPIAVSASTAATPLSASRQRFLETRRLATQGQQSYGATEAK